jgi:hypothetical protein
MMKVFVANRVGEVQNESDPKNWRFVPTDFTPTHIPTRVPKVKDLGIISNGGMVLLF